MEKPHGVTPRLQHLIIRLGAAAVGSIFLLSATPKIIDSYSFLANVYDYAFWGPTAGLAIAVYLPYLEFVLGIALVTGIFPVEALLLALGLLLGFVGMQCYVLFNGMNVQCGCFGANSDPVNLITLARTSAIALACGFLLLFSCAENIFKKANLNTT